MERDLTDKEVAELLGKHPRTVQRRCQAGKFPGAYKAGRSWRIPRSALRKAGLGQALLRDGAENEMRAARLVCEQLREELEALKGKVRPLLGKPPPQHRERNWRSLHRELLKLQEALEDLPELSGRVPNTQADGWRT